MSDTIREKERQTPVAHECNICIVGGSCTGVFAAIQAARLGAKVAIIENNGCFGGSATAGLVNIWHSLYDPSGSKQIIRGLTWELIERLQKKSALTFNEHGENAGYYIFNSAELMIELDLLLTEQPGIRPFLHARFADAVVENGWVTHAIIEDKSGRRAIKADYFIDASGDGDLISRAKLPYTTNSSFQPPAACAIIYGLAEIHKKYPDFNIHDAIRNSKYTDLIKNSLLCDSELVGLPGARILTGACVHDMDCSNADQLTYSEMEGRRQIRTVCDILKENFEGGEKVSLVSLPSYISIRETRHASCQHRISERELSEGTRFPDAVANGSYRENIKKENYDGEEKSALPFYQIPFRSLVPNGSKNVITAGRLIDVDKNAYNSLCVMVNCNQTGEAAGAAATLALDSSIEIPAINTNKLRETLRKEGSIII
ncbi:MAG: hypothetical protein A2017_20065 [Lentisphaerae bacterium GWF2_44_16]|nr:MAG: hypothetical protein A2017_20065 [Lentisphaerae bacterium GWF2_44_16]